MTPSQRPTADDSVRSLSWRRARLSRPTTRDVQRAQGRFARCLHFQRRSDRSGSANYSTHPQRWRRGPRCWLSLRRDAAAIQGTAPSRPRREPATRSLEVILPIGMRKRRHLCRPGRRLLSQSLGRATPRRTLTVGRSRLARASVPLSSPRPWRRRTSVSRPCGSDCRATEFSGDLIACVESEWVVFATRHGRPSPSRWSIRRTPVRGKERVHRGLAMRGSLLSLSGLHAVAAWHRRPLHLSGTRWRGPWLR